MKRRQKRRANSRNSTITVIPIRFSSLANLPTVAQASSPIDISEDTPPPSIYEDSLMAPIVERVFFEAVKDFPSSLHQLLSKVGTLGLRYTEASDKELADTRVELDSVCELYNKVTYSPFDVYKVDFDALADGDKRELFVEKGGSSTADLAPSTVGDVITLVHPSVTEDVIIVATTVENDALANQDWGALLLVTVLEVAALHLRTFILQLKVLLSLIVLEVATLRLQTLILQTIIS
ncbi:hypothetical protein J1N35_034440 [Gossypium stocksii]|uniref:Uncharacterized protein n=1 Tax=Gossypium stocksii TaxID=47602 RepID=A0A9D3USK7_9ROSI|nr:hypothetical protein J1N35_034440 [Gossypium stocksii]